MSTFTLRKEINSEPQLQVVTIKTEQLCFSSLKSFSVQFDGDYMYGIQGIVKRSYQGCL